jgi:hypothetical protein
MEVIGITSGRPPSVDRPEGSKALFLTFDGPREAQGARQVHAHEDHAAGPECRPPVAAARRAADRRREGRTASLASTPLPACPWRATLPQHAPRLHLEHRYGSTPDTVTAISALWRAGRSARCSAGWSATTDLNCQRHHVQQRGGRPIIFTMIVDNGPEAQAATLTQAPRLWSPDAVLARPTPGASIARRLCLVLSRAALAA